LVLPFTSGIYYGAYEMHGDLKDFTLKDGLWASEGRVYRGFEGEGMCGALNFDEFRAETKVLYRAGVEDVKGAMAKVVMD
jgi:hypothetical protein